MSLPAVNTGIIENFIAVNTCIERVNAVDTCIEHDKNNHLSTSIYAFGTGYTCIHSHE